MMRDVVIEEVGGTHVSFIAVFLILFGGAQLAMWVLFFVVATAFALLCGVVWLGVIISIAFIALGLGLLRRRDWAFTWTPVLMVVMIVLNIITIAVTPPSVIVFGPLIVVHALIGIGIMWEGRWFALRDLWTRSKRQGSFAGDVAPQTSLSIPMVLASVRPAGTSLRTYGKNPRRTEPTQDIPRLRS
jgi:hypothetical protein